MQKRTAIVVTVAAAVLALVGPILLALQVAREHALHTEEQRALLYAKLTLQHSEHIADQVDAAFHILAADRVSGCSLPALSLMRQTQLALGHIGALGYISGNKLLCLSVGNPTNDFDLGPAPVVEQSGVTVRPDIKFPFSKNKKFVLIGRDNYVAAIPNELPVDVMTASPAVTLAVFSVPHNQILIARGAIRPEWMDALHGRHEVVFESKTHAIAIVAVRTSLRYYIAAMAALPTAEVDAQLRESMVLLVPIGIAGSIALMFAVLQLSKVLVSMPTLIKAALKRNEFSLYYQPVVDLRTGQWTGAEALIRWHQQEGEIVRPDLFIPIAEACGLIQRVTERVLEILAQDAAVIFRRHPDFHIGVNLTPHDLHSEATIERLNSLVDHANAKPGNLMIEATERSLMDPALTGPTIRELKIRGYSFAVDDFGTGYSNLSYLGNFDFDLLKIDKAFVEAVDTDAATSHVVPHIIEMAKALNLKMIAEGVETEAQAHYLRARGVQYAQGWLFAKAMPLSELLSELKRKATENMLVKGVEGS
jgi:sensor c-di-GMP phosphodiesterase-like protein